MTITEFLLARIAEDEAVAQAAIDPERPGTHWQWVTIDTETVVAAGELGEAQEYQDVSLRTVEEFQTSSAGRLPGFAIERAGYTDPGAGEHIARYDPARVLAECAAKRAVVAEHGPQEVASLDRSTWGQAFIVCRVCALGARQVVAPCPTLKALAAVYADHPDYQPEWVL